MPNLKVFSGRAHPALAQMIAEYLGLHLGSVTIEPFPDGELIIKLEEDVRGRDIFIIQPTCPPTNELQQVFSNVQVGRASAERITAVIPSVGYARQDRKDEGRVPISAKLVANLISTAGADRVLTMDLHAGQLQGFFDVPVDNLYAEPILSKYYTEQNLQQLVLLSPDVGNAKRARQYADRLNGELAIIDKRRLSGSEAEMIRIIGDVKGKTVLMIDDMITTAGTICSAAELAKHDGAERILAGATHAILCDPAIERIGNAPIDEVVVTNSIPIAEQTVQAIGKLRVLSVAELMGEASHRTHHDESVSSLFL